MAGSYFYTFGQIVPAMRHSAVRTFAVFLTAMSLIFIAFGSLAAAQDAALDPSQPTLESFYKDRSQIDPSDLDALADIDLSILYTLVETEETDKIDTLIANLTPYISAPINEDTKSYIFFSIFYHHINEGRFDQAFDALNEYDVDIAELSDGDRILRRYTIDQMLGTLYLKLDYHDKAIQVLEEVLRNPKYQSLEIFQIDRVANLMTLSDAFTETNQHEKAVSYAKAATQRLDAELNSGRDFDEQVAAMTRLDVELRLAAASIGSENYLDAIDIASKVLETSTSEDRILPQQMANSILGRAHLKLNQPDKAARYLNAVINHPTFEGVGDDDARVYAYLGYVSEQRGNYKQAIAHFKKSNEIRTAWRAELDTNRFAFVAAENENAQRLQEISELRLINKNSKSVARRNLQLACLGILTTALAIFAFMISIRTSKQQRHAKVALAQYANKLEVSEARARKNERRAKDASKAKSAFLANMSHEIRTPMNGVLGMAQVLERTPLNDRQKEFLKAITTSGDALMTILNDILDLSKIEAGKLELDPRPANLRTAIENVASVLSGHANEKGLEIIVDYQPGISENFVTDIGRIRQVLMNLVGNALKFTETGHILVRVTNQTIQGNVKTFIQVNDTGVGIMPERLDAIFEDFRQAETSTARKYGGTGLGLSISQKIINAMGGALDVQSEYGKGTCFTISLALKPQTDVDSSPPENVQFPAKRVLIVEKNEAAASVLYRNLKAWGLSCDWADTGSKAYNRLAQSAQSEQAYDMIIMDVDLPDYSGVKVLEAIRQNAAISNVPIILTSCIHDDEHSPSLNALDISSFMPKPVKRDTLRRSITRALSVKTKPPTANAPKVLSA